MNLLVLLLTLVMKLSIGSAFVADVFGVPWPAQAFSICLLFSFMALPILHFHLHSLCVRSVCPHRVSSRVPMWSKATLNPGQRGRFSFSILVSDMGWTYPQLILVSRLLAMPVGLTSIEEDFATGSSGRMRLTPKIVSQWKSKVGRR